MVIFIGDAEVQKYLDWQSLMARTSRSDGAAATAISSFSKLIWRNCGLLVMQEGTAVRRCRVRGRIGMIEGIKSALLTGAERWLC
jgi:hypothetical protein